MFVFSRRPCAEASACWVRRASSAPYSARGGLSRAGRGAGGGLEGGPRPAPPTVRSGEGHSQRPLFFWGGGQGVPTSLVLLPVHNTSRLQLMWRGQEEVPTGTGSRSARPLLHWPPVRPHSGPPQGRGSVAAGPVCRSSRPPPSLLTPSLQPPCLQLPGAGVLAIAPSDRAWLPTRTDIFLSKKKKNSSNVPCMCSPSSVLM